MPSLLFFLLGALVMLPLAFAAGWYAARWEASSRGRRIGAGTAGAGERKPVSPHLWPGDRPGRTAGGSDQEPGPAPWTFASAPGDEPPPYRARKYSFQDDGSHWDPYAPSQHRHERVRTARKRARTAPPPPRPEPVRSSLYTLLGLQPGASESDIAHAYRRQAAQYHPDKFHDDPTARAAAEEKLKQLNAAMQVLRDPARRARYDATL